MYDANKIKAASEAAAKELLSDPENASLRGTVAGALGKLTAARDEAQLETLYRMAQGMKNNFDEKGNDAGAQAIGIVLTAIENGYQSVMGKALDEAAIFEAKKEEPASAVGIFSTKKVQNPSGGFVATVPTPTIAGQPEGALTTTDVSQAWPTRIQPEIRTIFDSIKEPADENPGTMHTVSYTSPRTGEILAIEGGKFRTSNTLNKDGIQKQNFGKPTYFVSAECYENVLKPYLHTIARMPLAEVDSSSYLTPRGAYERESFRSFHGCLNNVPPSVMQQTRDEVMAQMKQQADAGIAAHDDGSRTVRLDGKPLRAIVTPHGETLAVLVKVPDIRELQAIIKTRASDFRRGLADCPYSDTARDDRTGRSMSR